MCIYCEADPEKMKEYGKIFGYPECCIKEFIHDTSIMKITGKDPRNKTQIKVGILTHGFVPCKEHARLIKRKKITPEDLVRDTRNHQESSRLNKIADH
jgi:hypothetical protein